MSGDRIPWKGVEKGEGLVGYIIDRLDQKVPRAHRWIEHLDIEEVIDQLVPLIFDRRTGFVFVRMLAFGFRRFDALAMP